MGTDLVATAKAVIKGLGGAKNIKSSEPCITRIRCDLVDMKKLDEAIRAERWEEADRRADEILGLMRK